MPNTYLEKESRLYKRALSKFEKETLPSTEGRALLLPATPGGEIDEVLEAGFKLEDIDAFESHNYTYNKIKRAYGGQLALYRQDVMEAIGSEDFGEWSYVHLDFCNFRSFEELAALQDIIPNLADTSRLRLTVYSNPRNKDYIDNNPTTYWRTAIASNNLNTWGVWNNVLHSQGLVEEKNFHQPDYGLCVLAYLFMIFGFNFSVENAIEWRIDKKFVIPPVRSSFQIDDFMLHRYREHGSKNDMITLWVDLKKTKGSHRRKMIVDHVSSVISSYSTTPYNMPINLEQYYEAR